MREGGAYPSEKSVLVRAPGRIRPGGTGDTARFVSRRAIRHAKRRVSRALRWRSGNTWDSSDMPPAIMETTLPDTRVRVGSTAVSRGAFLRSPRKSPFDTLHCGPQGVEAHAISAWQRANHGINRWHDGEQLDARQFAEPALQSVSCHGRMAKSRNDHAHTRAMQRGSDVSHLELRGANSLPLNAYCLKVSLTRQTRRARKSKTARRRRTSTGASP